ncbi:MAG: hypothetical protein QM602_08510 [Microbacterium sp.]
MVQLALVRDDSLVDGGVCDAQVTASSVLQRGAGASDSEEQAVRALGLERVDRMGKFLGTRRMIEHLDLPGRPPPSAEPELDVGAGRYFGYRW